MTRFTLPPEKKPITNNKTEKYCKTTVFKMLDIKQKKNSDAHGIGINEVSPKIAPATALREFLG